MQCQPTESHFSPARSKSMLSFPPIGANRLVSKPNDPVLSWLQPMVRIRKAAPNTPYHAWPTNCVSSHWRTATAGSVSSSATGKLSTALWNDHKLLRVCICCSISATTPRTSLTNASSMSTP